MGQWGAEIVVGKARFIAHVATKGFEPIRPGHCVDYIMLLDDGGDPQSAEVSLISLKATMIGRRYARGSPPSVQ